MNKIFKSSLVIASIISAGFITGCDKEDDAPEIDKTAMAAMAGEWVVRFEVADAAGVYSDPAGDGRAARNVTAATAAPPLTPCSRGWAGVTPGQKKIITYNTADNSASQMWVGDIFGNANPRAINYAGAATRGTFYSFLVKANVDLGALTFSANDANQTRTIAIPATTATATCPTPLPAEGERAEDFNIAITDGKIIKGGSMPPSGTTTDSIHFMIKFGNDPFNRNYRVSGYRYTGFSEDEPH